jgi:hypothetical protein
MKSETNNGTFYNNVGVQYRSPPRIEATVTVPPSQEKSVVKNVSPHRVINNSSNSISILKKLNSSRSGQSGSNATKAKDRYYATNSCAFKNENNS